MDVEVLSADEWRKLRAIRLQALADSPDAYLSSFESENGWAESQWRRSFENARWVVIAAGGKAVGLAHSVRPRGCPPDERYIESVWVDPGHRHRGAVRTILKHLTELEPEVRSWLVWVLDSNSTAQRVYNRLGFESTGVRQALSDGRSEVRLRLRLDDQPGR